jgi:hypothetical protein
MSGAGGKSPTAAKTGQLYKFEATASAAGGAGTWQRLHAVLQGHRLLFFASDAKVRRRGPRKPLTAPARRDLSP